MSDGSMTWCHRINCSNNDHLLSCYLLSERTCVRCLTHLVSNPLNPTRQDGVIYYCHFTTKGIEVQMRLRFPSWEVVRSRIAQVCLAYSYHPTLYIIISPTALYAPDAVADGTFFWGPRASTLHGSPLVNTSPLTD